MGKPGPFLVVVGAFLFLGVTSAAAADKTDESTFLEVLAQFGIGIESSSTSVKPCLCTGATNAGDAVGRLVVSKDPPLYHFDCRIDTFVQNGSIGGFFSCRADGGTITLVNQ